MSPGWAFGGWILFLKKCVRDGFTCTIRNYVDDVCRELWFIGFLNNKSIIILPLVLGGISYLLIKHDITFFIFHLLIFTLCLTIWVAWGYTISVYRNSCFYAVLSPATSIIISLITTILYDYNNALSNSFIKNMLATYSDIIISPILATYGNQIEGQNLNVGVNVILLISYFVMFSIGFVIGKKKIKKSAD